MMEILIFVFDSLTLLFIFSNFRLEFRVTMVVWRVKGKYFTQVNIICAFWLCSVTRVLFDYASTSAGCPFAPTQQNECEKIRFLILKHTFTNHKSRER